MPERGFYFFEFFCYFFRNFLPRVDYERNSGLKFFSLFLGLSHPILATNNTGKRFFNFLNFFAISFGIFYVGLGKNRISDKNICFSFSAYPISFWLKIFLKKGFLIFGIFFIFFSEFSSSNRVRTDIETEIFFSLSLPVSTRFG